ncbi:hypothetical protein Q7M_1066 (plasmid) [Borrelia crocidurae str. Achema]|uniref:Uncharacterized protein n=2 Tax=Borrelia crocidurae TaxID=29520 RepID=I0FE68_BORCA|nr:hypothetical protein Q7M_1066 [Borrelia crocidurae str. Achema]
MNIIVEICVYMFIYLYMKKGIFMRIINIMLCILFILSCSEKNVDKSSENVNDSDDKDVCANLSFIRLVNIEPRYVTFYKIHSLVKEYRDKLHGRTFKLKKGESKPEFRFPLSKIFPVYRDADFIFESLNYNVKAIYGLEYMFHALILPTYSSILGDTSSLSIFLSYLDENSKVLKRLVNDDFNDETLERLKTTKTDKELALIYYYLVNFINRKANLDRNLERILIKLVAEGADRETVLKVFNNSIVNIFLKLPDGELTIGLSNTRLIRDFEDLKSGPLTIIKCLIK